MIKQVIEQQR